MFWRIEDLKPKPFPALDWTKPEQAAKNLEELRQFSVETVESALSWYYERRRAKRMWGLALTMLILVSFVLAGLVPLLVEATKDPETGVSPVPVLVASIALGCGAGLIALDRVWGCTAGWLRYVEAAQRLAFLLEDFRFGWELARVEWASSAPTSEQIGAAVDRCRQLVSDTGETVRAETRLWSAEFSRAVGDLQHLEVQRKPVKPG